MERQVAVPLLLVREAALIPALAIACYLLNIVPVTGCDSRMNYYVQQAQQIPPAHLAMIASISLWDQPNGDAGWPSRTIRLPATDHWSDSVLGHETGHIVAFTLKLNGSYEAEFWRDGRAVGLTTEYGRTAPKEDIAESYAAIVVGRPWVCSVERVAWLRERAFKGTRLGL